MRDKFVFSNGQDLGSLNTTGVISDYYWDLEEDVTVDQYLEGWINIIILTCTQTSGNEGIDIRLQSSDSTDCDTSAQHLGSIRLLESELVAGNRFSFGVAKGKLHKYLALWYEAISSALNNATTIDAWFALGPITSPDLELQKRPS